MDMDQKSKMVPKLKLFSILSLSITLLIGCGDGFRAATYEKLTDTVVKEKTVQEQLQEQIAQEKAEQALADKAAADREALAAGEQAGGNAHPKPTPSPAPAVVPAPASQTAAQPESKITQDELKVIEEKAGPIQSMSLDNVKEAILAVNPDLVTYLQGLTLSVRQVDEKKIHVEALMVISKSAGKKTLLMARQDVALTEEDAAGKVQLMRTENILHSQAMLMATTEEEMYKPSSNTKVGFICADAKCETAYLLIRSGVKKANEPSLLTMVLELKRHDGRFEIARTNASEKPLLINSYHDAE